MKLRTTVPAGQRFAFGEEGLVGKTSSDLGLVSRLQIGDFYRPLLFSEIRLWSISIAPTSSLELYNLTDITYIEISRPAHISNCKILQSHFQIALDLNHGRTIKRTAFRISDEHDSGHVTAIKASLF